MLAIAVVPFLVAVLGALIYGFASNPKLAELGRILLWTGALVTLWTLAGHKWTVGQNQPQQPERELGGAHASC